MSAPAWLQDAVRLYSSGQTLRQVGQVVGVSGERVRKVFAAHSIETRAKSAPAPDRFMRHVEVTEGHWKWTGGPHFLISEKRLKAPRNAAIELFRGEATEERLVSTCGVEGCIAPSHLVLSAADDGIRARLMARISVSASGCWEWTGPRLPSGYGHMSNMLYTHRAAYQLFVGPIPDGMHVCHRCDNPPCCNPEHLFLGTAADNMHDRDAKGRHRGGPNAPWRKRLAKALGVSVDDLLRDPEAPAPKRGRKGARR